MTQPTDQQLAELTSARVSLQMFRHAIGSTSSQITNLIHEIGRGTAPLRQAQRDAATYRARWEATVVEAKRQHAEADRLRAELATVRDATLHEAARVLEETGRDDDAVNLLDLLANSPTRPGCPDPVECDHEAELGQLRAELEQTRQQIAAVLAVCDAAEHQATRWEHPLPVPDWVTTVRYAAVQPTTWPVRACGCPSRFERHADGCPTIAAEATR